MFITCKPVFDTIRELKNGKKYETTANISISENNCAEIIPTVSAYESNTDTECETRIVTQEEVDEQIRNYNVSLTRQLDDLTRLIQGMSTAHRANLPPMASTSASSSAAGSSPNKPGIT